MSERSFKTSKKLSRIRWTARIWGGLIIAWVLLIIIGISINLITEGEADPHSEEDVPVTEYAGPILFFLSAVGLGLAYKWEGIGGAFVVVFQLLFIISQFIFRGPSMKGSFVFPIMLSLFVMLPGLLYIAYCRRSAN